MPGFVNVVGSRFAILFGGAFESRAAIGMTIRTTVWAAIFAFIYRWIGLKH